MNVYFRQSIVLLLAIFLLAGCSKVVEVQLAPEVNVLFSKERDKTISLTNHDPAYIELNNWLSENTSGWYPTSGKYPGGVYVISGDQGIQVTERRVVIYSTENGKTEATFVQEINNSDLLTIKNVANNSKS